MTSRIFRLNWRDLIKGLIVSVLFALFTSLQMVIKNSGLVLSMNDLLLVASSSVLSGLAYLTKNLLTDGEGKIAGIL